MLYRKKINKRHDKYCGNKRLDIDPNIPAITRNLNLSVIPIRSTVLLD